ncbi:MULTISPECIES: OmpH family outer membrane protein [unclassified Pyramidobacter]|uniref:OmpH family outer membrane protein n=1 Tax=unclassified Pyramidobacter TaxID=2632171 RepID=UPI00098F77E2|nr:MULTISPECIES: OmpH family outer membrane protein [unclassified Pyramidobacter]MCI7404297.1 OmpH family outer membrane protein [Pyramidobacter sp.]MDY3213307.1 OmpH family outer membrane protein [Pyramidobacter sp.]RKJ75618.1 OmpH family outer membrane protein [Pyramidobacter sp. CG50-2]WOL39080.1 OmpH family outer membrane protein [Pyramidobacter sp. YE332]
MRRAMTIFLAVLLMGAAAGTAPATEIAVVDAERILAQSTPGKKGQEHLNEVQKVLQKGYNDLVALYRGRENSPEAQEIIRQGQAALEQQMAVERNAVLAVLQSELMAATEAWQKKNPKIQAVVSRQLLLGAVPKLDVTSAVMKEMNKRTPKFAALPTVTVNKPAPAQPAQK